MLFITSPEPHSNLDAYLTVFLAGSIEQGSARAWHGEVAKALEEFSDGLVLLNPRRVEWDSALKQDIDNPQFNEQVNWEMDGIDKSGIVFMYLQAGTMSPISLLELGYACAAQSTGYHKRIIIVCEPEFWRRGNVQVLVSRMHKHTVCLFDDLESGIKELHRQVNSVMQFEHF